MKRIVLGIGVVAVVAMTAGGIAWTASASAARDKIFVYVDAVPFDCTQDIVSVEPREENTPSVPVIDISDPFSCTLSFQIRNDNDFDVTVTDATLPNYGPGFGSTPLATSIDSSEVEFVDESQIDATVHFGDDYVLPANDTYTFVVQLEQNPGACMSGGATAWSEQGPELTTSIFGIVEVVTSPTAPFGVTGTATTGCVAD